jgi:hypothetical protein
LAEKRALSHRKPANMAETRKFAFHFIFQKRYFSIYKGVSEDFTFAAFPDPPVPE